MPEWTIDIDTVFKGLDEDGLVRFADAFTRGFGYMGPACALHDGKLGFTVTVTAASAQDGLTVALTAAGRALSDVGFGDETEVEVTHISMESESAKELALA